MLFLKDYDLTAFHPTVLVLNEADRWMNGWMNRTIDRLCVFPKDYPKQSAASAFFKCYVGSSV